MGLVAKSFVSGVGKVNSGSPNLPLGTSFFLPHLRDCAHLCICFLQVSKGELS